MVLLYLITCLLFSANSFAQIADASFFPSVRSINPGIAHLRTSGFVALDVSKKSVDKVQDSASGNIIGGIKNEVDLTKMTVFRAGKGKGITTEFLFDRENGEKVEKVNSSTAGPRKATNQASSTYYGAILDLQYFGISYAGAAYDYTYKFRYGAPPSVSAKDIGTTLSFTNIKIGTAFKIRGVSLGAYMLDQKSKGSYSYTYFDPSTGNRGTTEKFPTSTSAKGFGAGLGVGNNRFRIETSIERMYGNKMSLSDDYPTEAPKALPSTRLSLVAEGRIRAFALGVRVRKNQANFTDLEDIISSNLLYGDMRENDSRLETTFNFTLGVQKGFTYSAFYTQSTTKSKELDPIFGGDERFDATTKSQAFGINLSYIY